MIKAHETIITYYFLHSFTRHCLWWLSLVDGHVRTRSAYVIGIHSRVDINIHKTHASTIGTNPNGSVVRSCMFGIRKRYTCLVRTHTVESTRICNGTMGTNANSSVATLAHVWCTQTLYRVRTFAHIVTSRAHARYKCVVYEYSRQENMRAMKPNAHQNILVN